MANGLSEKQDNSYSDDWRKDLREREGISGSDDEDISEIQGDNDNNSTDKLGQGYTKSKGKKKLSEGLSFDDLNDAESQGSDIPKGYTGKLNIKVKANAIRKKRMALGGGITGFILLGIFGIGSFSSGPLSILNAAAHIKINLNTVEDQGDDMSTRAILYAMAGKANRGRLGMINNRIADSYEKKMIKSSGLRPVYSKGGTNRFIGFEVIDKDLAKSSGMLDEFERQGVSPKKDTTGTIKTTKGTSPTGEIINLENSKFGKRRSAIRTVGSATDTNALVKFYLNRLSIKRGGISLHIFNNLKKKAEDKTPAYKKRVKDDIQQKVAKGTNGVVPNVHPGSDVDSEGKPLPPSDATEKLVGDTNSEINQAHQDASSSLEEKKKPKFKAITTGAVLAAVMCAARSISDGYDSYIYANNVLPLMRLSAVVMSSGSQIQAGEDLNMEELSVLGEMLFDETAPEFEQDFNDNVITRNYEGRKGGAEIPGEADVRVEKPGTLQVVDKVFSGGLFNPANIVCDISDTVSGLPIIKQVGDLTNWALDGALSLVGLSMEQLIGGLYSLMGGPGAVGQLAGGAMGAAANVGGHLLAGDQSANIGGRDISNSAYLEIQQDALNEIAYQNSKKSIFDRYFNTLNTNSLAFSILKDNKKLSPNNIVASLLNMPSSASNSIVSISSPSAFAAERITYPYKISYKGFTREQLDDPAFQDLSLNDAALSSLPEKRLIELNEKYGKCFGATIDIYSGKLINGASINPVGYNGSSSPDCSSAGNYVTDSEGNARSELERYQFMLAYATTLPALACDIGDEESCNDLGINNSSSLPDSSSNSSDSSSSYGNITAGFPLKTTKESMKKSNGSCFNDLSKTMCRGGHPYYAYDIMADQGTPVVSLFDGKVTSVSTDKCPGRFVSIYSADLGVTVSYMHMSMSNTMVSNGQTIKAGDQIGIVGTLAEGCVVSHLHIDAALGSRPGCSRENCPEANKKIFIDGNNKIGLDKLLYQGYSGLN